MPEPATIVIAGGGVCAARCAMGLRTRGYDGRVVVVAAEPHLPYDRTLVSKDLLKPTPPREVLLHGPDEYAERGIEVRTGVRATGLDAGRHELHTTDGPLGYDRLVICTGGEPVLPESLAAPGVHLVRELGDAEALRAALDRGGRLVVVGGGFIGGEVASAAVARGLSVTLIEALEQPLVGAVGPAVGARVAELHRRHGVKVLTGAPVAGIERGEAGYRVRLASGRALRADVVVVGTGMRPATGWLEGSGVELDAGVVTDERCATAVPDVLAAGDCARWQHPHYGVPVRVEHWDTARRHGDAAAAAALGAGEPFDALPFFWSDQHGTKLQWVGLAPRWDRVEIEDGPAPGTFAARYWADDRLVAMLAAGQPRAIAEARRELMQTAPAMAKEAR
jgi:3-phenylpropionate/trans-cinnamate dioxygenase ferredoxin reductase subunit